MMQRQTLLLFRLDLHRKMVTTGGLRRIADTPDSAESPAKLAVGLKRDEISLAHDAPIAAIIAGFI
jgi:hypothetical protein